MAATWLIMFTLTLVSSTKPLTRKQYQGDRNALVEQLRKTNDEIEALQAGENSELDDEMDDSPPALLTVDAYYDYPSSPSVSTPAPAPTTTTTTPAATCGEYDTASCGEYETPCVGCNELQGLTYTGDFTSGGGRWCGGLLEADCCNAYTFQNPHKSFETQKKRYYRCGWGEKKGKNGKVVKRCKAAKSFTCENDKVNDVDRFAGSYQYPSTDCTELESLTYTGETKGRWCGKVKDQNECGNFFTFQNPKNCKNGGCRYYSCGWVIHPKKGGRCKATKSFHCPNDMVKNKNYFTSPALLTVDSASTRDDVYDYEE